MRWGEEVMASLTPGQQVIKIVNDELTELMGGTGQQTDLFPEAGLPRIHDGRSAGYR